MAIAVCPLRGTKTKKEGRIACYIGPGEMGISISPGKQSAFVCSSRRKSMCSNSYIKKVKQRIDIVCPQSCS
jgi:hypothetical protein